MKKNIFYTLCLLFLVGNLYSQQTVWVKAGATGTGNGSSEVDAFTTIGAGLLQIDSAGDILRVVGTVPASGIALSTTTAGVSLNKNFAYTIEGDAGGSTLTGTAGATRMFTINSASVGHNVTFKNIKFTGATGSTGAGGGVLLCNQPATVNFENCIFDGNSLASTVTQGGGALYFTNVRTPSVLAGPTVTITDCTFKNNTSPNIGGAIFYDSTSLTPSSTSLTITRTTFYNNKTLGTTITPAVWGGAALYVGAGTASVNSLTNCTFYQNTAIFPVNVNQDYGIIRTDAGNTTVTNCLFYDNKAAIGNPITSSAPSDWGASATGTQTFDRSIGQWITSNIDFRSNFISFVKASTNPLEVAANLASSNLTYDDAIGKVTYTAPTVAGENSPIDFGSDGKDAGAWQFGTTPTATPTFTQVDAICSGGSLSALPTTSNNAITGTWSPALNNSATTTYTFTPSAGQSAVTATMTIAVNTTSAPASESQTFCGSGTIANLVATGTAIQWYSDATGGTALSSDAALASGTYYVTQNINGCESYRTAVAVTVTAPLTTSAIRMVPSANAVIPSVTIGTQTWTTKNLDVATYSDGSVIPQVQDATAWANLTTGAWCYYNNDPANGAIYGKLYNWYAVAGIWNEASKTDASQRKKLAPVGYHIPSDNEWTTLTDSLGGEAVAGGKMKETGNSHWNSPNQDATNSSGFTGLPGGSRYSYSEFGVIGNDGYWWSSTDVGDKTWSRYLANFFGTAGKYDYFKAGGFSVRLIKD